MENSIYYAYLKRKRILYIIITTQWAKSEYKNDNNLNIYYFLRFPESQPIPIYKFSIMPDILNQLQMLFLHVLRCITTTEIMTDLAFNYVMFMHQKIPKCIIQWSLTYPALPMQVFLALISSITISKYVSSMCILMTLHNKFSQWPSSLLRKSCVSLIISMNIIIIIIWLKSTFFTFLALHQTIFSMPIVVSIKHNSTKYKLGLPMLR